MGLAAHRDDPARGRSKNPVEQQSCQRERPEEVRAEVSLEAVDGQLPRLVHDPGVVDQDVDHLMAGPQDRKSTRLNSSHVAISYAVFCLNKITAEPPDAPS